MDSLESQRSEFTSLKSKEILQWSSDDVAGPPDHALWNSKTPEKPLAPPRRSSRARNSSLALSVKEVKEIASGLRESTQNPSHLGDEVGSSNPDEPQKQIKSPLGKLKRVRSPIKLLEKCEMLSEFFNSMDSSIRLLRMKGSMPTFTNVSRKIECLTYRFLLPEVIETKKVMTLDEETSCMKPDIRITLNGNAIEYEGKLKLQSGNLSLRKVFRSRLLDFCKAHPEGHDIPEETLPEPFNWSKQDSHISTRKDYQPPEASTDAQFGLLPAVASHLSQSFCRKFSNKLSGSGSGKFDQKLSLPLHMEETISSGGPSNVELSNKPATSRKCLAFGASALPLQKSPLPETPSKKKASTRSEACSTNMIDDFHATPVKLISTPVRLMTVTPAMAPPKRICTSPDDDSSTSSSNKLVRRTPRSLKFDTPVKNSIVKNEDILDILPENLVQSIREKERQALEEKDPAISQAKKRQEMVATLPKLFNTIHFFFQSIKCSVIIKEELVHNIIASHFDVVDQREVEERLKLMQELVPEWIYEKLSPSGDCLLCINKGASMEALRLRLTEAK